MSKKKELFARLKKVRTGKKRACSGIMEAEDRHDSEAQEKHIATLSRLADEEKEIMSKLKELQQEE